MGEDIDIFRLSGMKYPIHILASTFSTVSLEVNNAAPSEKLSQKYLQKTGGMKFSKSFSFCTTA